MHVEVVADGLLELSGRTMRAAADVVLSERGEPALDLIEPRRRSGSEVDMESRVACEPGLDRGRLVGGVVVHHEMDIELRWQVGVDRAQELQELAATVSAVKLSDDLAGGDVQRRKERRRAMARVVVSAPLGDAWGQRQQRLRARSVSMTLRHLTSLI